MLSFDLYASRTTAASSAISLTCGLWFSLATARHNTHHVVTNEVANDPDIKTTPFLHFAQQFPDLAARLRKYPRIVSYQYAYYLPFIAVLDLYWRFESIQYLVRHYGTLWRRTFTLVLHYMLLAYVWSCCGIWPLIAATLLRGFATALIVFATHYSEERIRPEDAQHMSLLEQTVRTSRNITGNAVLHFLAGNISYQIEHHLFPMLPRSNLPVIQPRVRALCAKHQLPYNQDTLVDCTLRAVRSLHPVNALSLLHSLN